MFKNFASAVVMVVAAACVGAPAAHATQFLTAIDDVPLPSGLTEQPEPLIFESDQGRVVRTSAEGNVDGERIATFYEQTLPALGWRIVLDPDGMAFERENERLVMRIREPANAKPVRVEFELVVKLASTRLPD